MIRVDAFCHFLILDRVRVGAINGWLAGLSFNMSIVNWKKHVANTLNIGTGDAAAKVSSFYTVRLIMPTPIALTTKSFC